MDADGTREAYDGKRGTKSYRQTYTRMTIDLRSISCIGLSMCIAAGIEMFEG